MNQRNELHSEHDIRQPEGLIVITGAYPDRCNLQQFFDRVLEYAENELALVRCNSIGEVISQCYVRVAEVSESECSSTGDEQSAL